MLADPQEVKTQDAQVCSREGVCLQDSTEEDKIKRCVLLGSKAMTNLDSILKSRDITLLTKVCIVKAVVCPVVMYGCESWTIKKAKCWRTDAFELLEKTRVLEKTLNCPLDCKEIKPVNPKGNQSWIFIGRTDAEVEVPIHWPADAKNWLIGKDPDSGKDWRQEEGTTEDEMIGWHPWLDGHEFEQALGVGDGQEGLACCSPCGHKESDTTEQLNWTTCLLRNLYAHQEATVRTKHGTPDWFKIMKGVRWDCNIVTLCI